MANERTFRSEQTRRWYLPLILGLLFIAVGIWIVFTPVESFLALAIRECKSNSV